MTLMCPFQFKIFYESTIFYNTEINYCFYDGASQIVPHLCKVRVRGKSPEEVHI